MKDNELQTATYNLIYVLGRDTKPGILKIGKTEVDAYDVKELVPNCQKMYDAVVKRYKDSGTSGDTDLHILYTEVAWYIGSDGLKHKFHDTHVHDVLLKSNYKKEVIKTDFGTPDEWFQVDLDHVKQAITAVKEERQFINGPKIEKPKHPVIDFREEQKAAINETLKHFGKENGKQMLWNAKMRFGKTLCALELINRMDFERVLILTHRPAVRSGWFDDFHKIRFKSNYLYGSKKGKATYSIDDEKNKDEYERGKDFKTLQDRLAHDGTHYIYFASMQDLRGKVKKAGKKVFKDNNEPVYSTKWDLIIVDEAHEGTLTPLGKEVLSTLKKNGNPKMLYLSGTPYNILSKFEQQEIYTWDYVMEQEAKERWPKEHPNKPNPYDGLAQLHIYSYSLGEVFERNPEYIKSEDDYFNFVEFFRTWTGLPENDGQQIPPSAEVGHFVHEQDVVAFLDLLCCEEPVSYYPFSNNNFRQALSHTLWMLPGVAAANRLGELILQHKLHTEYQYAVVSVAGEGMAIADAGDDADKIERKERDALNRVKEAIKANRRTITLSCGRLTTGVSVREWTGVLMLSGGYSTGAANYMQTIFRGQTPYNDGAIKKNCYAFDFAPDRTLTVVDDFIRQQPQSRNTPSNTAHTERTESTLRHLPVVAMVGGREVEYDAKRFVNDVNSTYADHVISHGFKSRKLFRNLASFTEKDHELLSDIGKIMGGANYRFKGDGTLVVASNNLTDKGGSKTTATGKKEPKVPSAKKPKAANDAENERIKHSQQILDYIFVRLPLLLFGAAKDGENVNFKALLDDDFIDRESWKEFMPKNLTKELFKKIAPLIKDDVLMASANRIIEETRAADTLPIEERTHRMADIIAHFRFPDKETVLTPWRVVNMHMADTIGGYDFYNNDHMAELPKPRFVDQGEVTAIVLGNPDTRILEINSKSGVYPLWITYSLWRLQHTDGMTADEEWRLWGDILKKNLFVVCQTRMAEKITRRVLTGYRSDLQSNTVAIEGLATKYKEAKNKTTLINKIKNMATYNDKKEKERIEFTAVVGNPPYQVVNNGNANCADPLYHIFIDLGMELGQCGTLIHPARFLFNAGKTPKDWNEKMLNNPQFKVVKYWADSSEVFPSVDIKGGVAVTFWDKRKDFGTIGTFSTHEEINTILKKVQAKVNELGTFSSKMFVASKFNSKTLFSDFPQYDGHERRMSSNVLKFDCFHEEQRDDDVQIYGSIKGKRIYRYINREYVDLTDSNILKYKIATPKADGSGAYGDVLTSPQILEPNSGFTHTFLGIGGFDSKEEAENALKYIKSKFSRALLGVLKVTQDLNAEKWQFVPLQDFTSSSDIDWSQSIEDIDRQLYKKYGLTKDEVAFIERMIKPMA